jgi:hypothetical protein
VFSFQIPYPFVFFRLVLSSFFVMRTPGVPGPTRIRDQRLLEDSWGPRTSEDQRLLEDSWGPRTWQDQRSEIRDCWRTPWCPRTSYVDPCSHLPSLSMPICSLFPCAKRVPEPLSPKKTAKSGQKLLGVHVLHGIRDQRSEITGGLLGSTYFTGSEIRDQRSEIVQGLWALP